MRFICPIFSETIPEIAQRCISASCEVVRAVGHLFDVYHMPPTIDEKAAAIAKDRYVLDLACSISDAAFIDWDIEILVMPNTVLGSPYFIHEFGGPRIGYFIVNGRCDWFRALREEKTRRRIENVFGYPNKLLRDKKTGEIPADTYRHYRITSKNGVNHGE